MLHTRIHKSRMVIMIKQLMPECTSCVARCAQRTMRQLSTLDPLPGSECGTGVNRRNGRENIRHNWTGEYRKATTTREMLNKNK